MKKPSQNETSSRTLVKWRECPAHRHAAIAKRLRLVRIARPSGVPPLVSYGWCGHKLRAEFERIDGEPLATALRTLRLPAKVSLARDLFLHFMRWQSIGFVHGDISLRNILVSTKPGQRCSGWFIDWCLDLESKNGTPLFTPPSVHGGKKTALSDRYALEMILHVYLLEPNAKRQHRPLGQATTGILRSLVP